MSWEDEVPDRDDVDTCLYIIAQLDADWELIGPVKIGISNNPRGRLLSLQTGSPHRLVLAGRYHFWRRDHALEVEHSFHDAAQEFRMNGEWFDIKPDAAVSMMIGAIRSFVDQVLQPIEPEQIEFAFDYIGLPGFSYPHHPQNFRFRR